MKLFYPYLKKELSFFINNPIILFLLFFWMSIFFSVNSRPDEIQFFGIDIARSINAARIFIPISLTYLTSFYLFFIFFINYKKIYYNKIYNITFLFYIYCFLQALGLAFNANLGFNLNNYFLAILSLGTLNALLLLKIYKQEKYGHLFIKASIFVLITAIIVIFYFKKNEIFHQLSFFNLYSLTRPHELFLYQEYPRSTGISRTLAVINLFFLVYFTAIKNIKLKIIAYIPILIVSFLIWAMQSRGTIICYYTAVIVLVVIDQNIVQKKIIHLLLILVMPILIFNFIITRSQNIDNVEKKFLERPIGKLDIEIRNTKVDETKIDERLEYFLDRGTPKLRVEVMQMDVPQKLVLLKSLIKSRPISRFERKGLNSSGRTTMWKYALKEYDKTKIFGYGPQADRYLLKRFMDNYSTNISNAALHAFLNAGYFALIIFLIIYLKLIYFIYKIMITKKIISTKQSKIFRISLVFIVFFSVRALIENSFTVFSIDFLIFIISVFIIDETHKKISYK